MYRTLGSIQCPFRRRASWQACGAIRLSPSMLSLPALRGSSTTVQATVLAGKVAHYTLLAAIPTALHGCGAVWPAMAAYIATQV